MSMESEAKLLKFLNRVKRPVEIIERLGDAEVDEKDASSVRAEKLSIANNILNVRNTNNGR